MGQGVYEKLKVFVDAAGVKYREIEHAPGASAEEYHQAVGCAYEEQLKCLLVKVYGAEQEWVMVTVPANKRVDLETVKAALGVKKVRMANREELKERTGCDYGELPALASVLGMRLLMDRDFLEQEEVYMNAGVVDRSLVVSPQVLEDLEKPIMI